MELCDSGDLIGSQEYLRLNPEVIIDAWNDMAFRHCCYKAHLKQYLQIAKWLFQVYKERNKQIHMIEMLFRDVCHYGVLEVAKWLLEIKPDMDICFEDNAPFRLALEVGNMDIAKWLQQIRPYLYVINYDINGKYKNYYIRNKEEENFERRKYALFLSTNKEDKNILYEMPIDVSKMAIQFV